jgi:hypothetical protein
MIPDLRILPAGTGIFSVRIFIDKGSGSSLDKVIKFSIFTERLAGVKQQRPGAIMNIMTKPQRSPMKNANQLKNAWMAACAGLVLVFAMTGCSDDEAQPQPSAADAKKMQTAGDVHNPFDHTHDEPVTDIQKHKFEHDFAAQCVEREVKNSTDKEADKARWEKPCMCIATYMMKNLTADEAKKFLDEHKNTQSLVIKYENAAYHCLQAKQQPKSPQLFGRQ